jgi:hypothetical protein
VGESKVSYLTDQPNQPESSFDVATLNHRDGQRHEFIKDCIPLQTTAGLANTMSRPCHCAEVLAVLLSALFPHSTTRYLPEPTNQLPPIFKGDFNCIFDAKSICALVKQQSVYFIEESQIRSKFLESEIAGARERVELKSWDFEQSLYRGDLLRLQSTLHHPGHYDHILVVSNTQWMNNQVAWVRAIGYHVSGTQVDPSDKMFGTRIFVIPAVHCDVVFPPLLRNFALEVTKEHPYFYPNIRKDAVGSA